MKAPDKIYMLPEELDERSEWLTEPYEDRDVAYIRNDVLLEWAKDKLSFCKEMIQKGEPGFEYKICVYEQFIDKLNSL